MRASVNDAILQALILAYWLKILKMHGNPENARESLKNISFCKKIDFWVLLLAVREYQKFSNPEREYWIPEYPVPGKFGNTEFPNHSHSRTSVFP